MIMKEQKIKAILDRIADEQKANTWMYESKKIEIASKLANLKKADLKIVRETIESSSILIKEAVDFSSTAYLLAQIVEIINEE
jgi:hypothetical protein